MVMEAPPSPDSVGREFVRQYYTLLNKAPTHLHRFYNNQSSFVHGGLDPPHRETLPMIGQKQIHQKIQQLNFQDCHAKITQVDAQATLGNGVVVQVTGELSNAGQPMRRFTQTFVLAAQSPKKYYVHNDIFRYQDEIISDEECENETRSGDEADLNPERHDLQSLNQPNLANYYNPNTAPLPQVPPHHQQHHVMQPVPPPPQQQPAVAVPLPTVNGAVHQDEMMPATMPPHITTPTLPPTTSPPLNTNVVKNEMPIASPPVHEDVTQHEEVPVETSDKGNYMDNQPSMNIETTEQHLQMNNEPVCNEPKTYATLLKSGNTPFPVSAGGGGGVYNPSSCPPPKSTSPPPAMKSDNRERETSPFISSTNNQQRNSNRDNNRNMNNSRNSQPLRPPRSDGMRSNGPRDNNMDGGNNYPMLDDTTGRFKSMKMTDERRRSQGTFNDSNQLFLGNLPLTASEDDLREVFEKFGPIADLRIHNKSSNKAGPPGTRAPPNYGFITYETQQGVQACLAAKPIYFHDKNSVSTLLNVEEKKVKERTSYGNMRNNQADNLSPRPPRGDNGPPRRGPMPGGQPRNSGGGQMGPGGGGQRPNNYNNRGGPANRGGPNNYVRR